MTAAGDSKAAGGAGCPAAPYGAKGNRPHRQPLPRAPCGEAFRFSFVQFGVRSSINLSAEPEKGLPRETVPGYTCRQGSVNLSSWRSWFAGVRWGRFPPAPRACGQPAPQTPPDVISDFRFLI